jgi:hypothetical protein
VQTGARIVARILITSGIAAGFACRSRLLEVPLKYDVDAKTAILVFQSSEMPPHYAILDLQPGAVTSAQNHDYDGKVMTTVSTLLYKASSVELLLEPVADKVPLEGDCRALPPPDEVIQTIAVEDHIKTSTGSFVPADLSAVLLPLPNLLRCTSQGGCVTGSTRATERSCWPASSTCVLPCPVTSPAPPAEPDPPIPPMLEPCRTSTEGAAWTLIPGDPPTCEPPVPPALVSCTSTPDGLPLWQPYGSSACEPFETDSCPPSGSGSFGNALPNLPTVYVRMGSSGDGSITAPFGSIQEATTQSQTRVIAIAEGTYAEDIDASGYSLYGACAGRTVITGFVSLYGPAHSELHHLTLRGTPSSIAARGGTMVLDHVVIEDSAAIVAIHANGASLTGDNVLVRHIAAPPAGGRAGGWGVCIQHGATSVLRHAVLEDSAGYGLSGDTAASIALSDAVIRDTKLDLGDANGIALVTGSTLTATRIDVADNLHHGLALSGSSAVLRDARIREDDGGTAPSNPYLWGVQVMDASKLDADGLVILGNRGHGLSVLFSIATVRNALVRGTLASEAGMDDAAIFALGATVGVSRVFLDTNSGGGIRLRSGARADIEDLVVDWKPGASSSSGATGLTEVQDSRAKVSRMVVRHSPEAGYASLMSSGELVDVLLEQTEGIDVSNSTLTSTRTALRATIATGRGALSLKKALSRLCDLEVSSSVTSMNSAFGINVDGGRAWIKRARSSDSPLIDVEVRSGAQAVIDSLTIRNASMQGAGESEQPRVEVCNASTLTMALSQIVDPRNEAIRIEASTARVSDLMVQSEISGARVTARACLNDDHSPGTDAPARADVDRFVIVGVRGLPVSNMPTAAPATLTISNGILCEPSGTSPYPAFLLDGSIVARQVFLSACP